MLAQRVSMPPSPSPCGIPHTYTQWICLAGRVSVYAPRSSLQETANVQYIYCVCMVILYIRTAHE